jgi:hypothetical protein
MLESATMSLRAGLLAVAVLAAVPASAPAQEEKGVFGLGLIIGEPTGVSAKYYLSDDTAIDAAAGGAVVGRGIQVHADFLWHPWILEQQESFILPFYLGPGVRVLNRDSGGGEEDHLRIGLRGVIGIVFDFTSVPLDVFVEVAGVADYRTLDDDHFGLDLNAGAGLRYYF